MKYQMRSWALVSCITTLAALFGACGGAVANDVPCGEGGDCPADGICSVSGVCLAPGECREAADCMLGELCESGHCQSAPPCDEPADCGAGTVCSVNGTCIPEGSCAGAGDCSGTTFCSEVSHACIASGSCAGDADCDPGFICLDASHTCDPGSDCGATELDITPIPPNLLIELDRSCSMKNLAGGQPKWTSAVNAITSMTTDFDGEVRWGLDMFPDQDSDSCNQGASAVPVGAGNEGTIQGLLTAALAQSDVNYPDGPCVTNIDTAMLHAATEPALMDPSRQSYVMLVTDGAQAGCSAGGGNQGTKDTIRDLEARGVKTFVVGFGDEVNTSMLDAFADLGGVPLAGATHYYQADDAASLASALGEIAGRIVSCDFHVSDAPADLSMVYVFFNNQELVPRDQSHAAGWDYDPASETLTLYGTYCDRLRDRIVDDLDVVFGCPGPVIE